MNKIEKKTHTNEDTTQEQALSLEELDKVSGGIIIHDRDTTVIGSPRDRDMSADGAIIIYGRIGP